MAASRHDGAARTVWVLLHRYVGLAIAAFIAIAGLTGSVLAYIRPLQDAFVGDTFASRAQGTPLGLDELTLRVEAHAPSARIAQWPLQFASGRTAVFPVEPKQGTASPELGYDAVHVDPVSGAILGTTRGDEQAPVAGRVLNFLYALHTSLALPGAWSQWGLWIMGVAALLWFFDCFVGAWLTLPKRPPRVARWGPAWRVKRSRLNFDLHRAGGLWFFGMLAILALSSVQQNLNGELFMPVARAVLKLSPDLFAGRAAGPVESARPVLAPQAAAARAVDEAARRGWSDAPERMQHDVEHAAYRVVFTTPPAQWATAVRRELYLDDRSGAVVGVFAPESSTTGDMLLGWLAALHFGTVGGWPYKLLLCVTGMAIGTLSVTGVVVWWRKRSGRQAARRRSRRGVGASAAPFHISGPRG